MPVSLVSPGDADPKGGLEMAEKTEKTYTQRIKVAGDQALGVVRKAVHEGNVRRIVIRNEKDDVLVELPVTIGVVGALVAPVAAAIGAVAALVAHCTIEIERVGEAPTSDADEQAATTEQSEARPEAESSEGAGEDQNG